MHGTRFLVEATPGGTSVAVDRGRVRVAGARTLDVAAGFQIIPGATQPMAIGADFAARLAALDGPLAAGPTESLDVFADVADADRRRRRRRLRPGAAVAGADAGRAHACACARRAVCPSKSASSWPPARPMLFHAELPELSSVEEPEPQPHAAATTAPLPVGAADLLARARADVLAGAYDRAIGALARARARPGDQAAAGARRAARGAGRAAGAPSRARAAAACTRRRAATGPRRSRRSSCSRRRSAAISTIRCAPPRPTRPASVASRRGIFAEEAALRRGEALLAAGETDAGVEALERYLRQYPTAPHVDDAHLSIASARRDRLGDCAGAVPHLRAVADGRGPRAELALIGEARCLRTLGRGDEARERLREVPPVQPHGRYADEARLGATGSAKLIP